MAMADELQQISKLIHSTYYGNAWHGPAVKQVLAGITEEQSLLRLPHSHSIIELVGHMTAWRAFVVRKLQGDVGYSVSDEANFPTAQSWEVALAELDESQEALADAIADFEPGKLYEVVPHKSYTYTFYALLHGIIHHDLYHIGQIALTKKQTI